MRKLIINGVETYYDVYEDGRVYSNKTKTWMKPVKWKSGCASREQYYYIYTIRVNKKPVKIGMHRVIALCYIPNPQNKECVNHIDGNGLNNNISNLEWVTHSENSKHAFSIGLRKTNKTYLKLTPEQQQEIVALKGSMSQYKIAKLYDIDQSYVCKLQKGTRG